MISKLLGLNPHLPDGAISETTYWTCAMAQLALLLLAALLCYRAYRAPARRGPPGRYVSSFAIFLIGLGVLLRCTGLGAIAGGQLMMDEISVTRLVTAGLLRGQVPYNGATNATNSVLVLLWQAIFGTSPLSVRSHFCFIGLLGLLFFFLAAKRTAGKTVALWGTALLSLSLYGSFYTRAAIETGTPLFYASATWYAWLRWRDRPTVGFSFALGVFAAASLFTYPGYAVGACALGAAVVAWAWSRRDRIAISPLAPPVVALASGFLVTFAGFLYLHACVAASPSTIFLSPGLPSWNVTDFGRSVLRLMSESLLNTDGPMTYFPAPFFEPFLWPFFLWGACRTAADESKPAAQIFLWLFPFGIFFASFATSLPGARRVVFLLLPFYFFSAKGIAALLEKRTERALGLATAALILIYVTGFATGVARPLERKNFYARLWMDPYREPLHDEAVIETLKRGDLVLAEPPHPLERLYYENLKFFFETFGQLPRTDHRVVRR